MSGSIPDTITSTINNSAALLVFADLPKKAEECEKLHKFLNWIDYKCDSRQRAFWLNDSSLTMLPWSNMSCSNELDAYFKKIYENRKKCQGAQKSMCYAFPYQFSRRAVQSCPIFRIDSTGTPMLGVIHICFGKSVEAYGRAFFDEVSTAKSFKLPINPNYDFTDYNHIIIMVNEDKKSQQHSIESTAWTRDISIGQNRVLFAVSTYSIAAFADLFDLEKINTKISRSSILPSVSFSVSFEKCGEHGADQLKIDIDNAIDDGFDLYFLIGDQLRKGNSTIRCDLKKTYPRWIKWGLFDSITKKLCSCGVRAVEHKMFLKKIADEDLKTIAIFGLARSGKSTFINTVFRTLTGIKKEFACVCGGSVHVTATAAMYPLWYFHADGRPRMNFNLYDQKGASDNNFATYLQQVKEGKIWEGITYTGTEAYSETEADYMNDRRFSPDFCIMINSDKDSKKADEFYESFRGDKNSCIVHTLGDRLSSSIEKLKKQIPPSNVFILRNYTDVETDESDPDIDMTIIELFEKILDDTRFRNKPTQVSTIALEPCSMFFDEYREMFPEYSPIPPGEITEARRRREKKEQAAMEKIRKIKEVNVKTKKTK